MIIVEGDVGVDAANAKSVEQMRLPQVADIVIDAAGFDPAGYRPDIADEDDEESDGAKIFRNFIFA